MVEADIADQRVTWHTWAGFSAMCIGMFMAILDIQIVVTSLPAIRDALEISPDRMSWIQTAYLIAEVIAIPLTGLFSRALSLRRLFLIALSLFTLASIGCAFSPDFATLIVFRIALGLLAEHHVPDGSALFNLMRNLGGAIGIALIDTVIWKRAPVHAEAIGAKLLEQDEAAAAFAGIDINDIPPVGFIPPETLIDGIRDIVENAGLTMAINEAWAMLAVFTTFGLLLTVFVRNSAISN